MLTSGIVTCSEYVPVSRITTHALPVQPAGGAPFATFLTYPGLTAHTIGVLHGQLPAASSKAMENIAPLPGPPWNVAPVAEVVFRLSAIPFPLTLTKFP